MSIERTSGRIRRQCKWASSSAEIEALGEAHHATQLRMRQFFFDRNKDRLGSWLVVSCRRYQRTL